MAADLRTIEGRGGTSSVVHHCDARALATQLKPRSIDAVITSPPYPNEKDYTRTTRLESVLLGLITSKQQLRSFKHTLVRSNVELACRYAHSTSAIHQISDLGRVLGREQIL